jgi:hypothetical protein|tara:strand:- start:145 stop:720 length:576 start_codon:yes stop_codon:yes gene_type:complete
MANETTNHIEVIGNKKAEKKFIELSKKMRDHPNPAFGVFAALWSDGEWEDSYSWASENAGAKWVLVEDCQDDYINLQSAWYQCDGVHEKLYNILKEYDSEVEVHMIYEDGAALYTGRAIWYDGDLIDECEEDGLDEELCEIAEKAGEGPWDDAWMERLNEVREIVYENAENILKEAKESKKQFLELEKKTK